MSKQGLGSIYVQAKIINAIIGSAPEAKVGGLNVNALELLPMRTALEELDYLQPPTPIHTDNSTTDGIVNNIIKQTK